MFPECNDKTTLKSGYNRSLLAWYTIDPLFTRRSSSLTPSHIKSDLDQLSNYYVREVYVRELFPNRNQSSYSGATSTLPILNLAYYPNERGPYNFSTNVNYDGTLVNPEQRWGGMMRKLETTDFENSNIAYIEFWMLDPFLYTNDQSDASTYGGDFYINLGEVSEDVLRDGKKFHESGMPVDGSNAYVTTQWGKIPTTTTVTYAFATTSGARALQDVGFNGLNDSEEQTFASYQEYLSAIQGKVSPVVFDSIWADPANDDYHYFRGSDFDRIHASILQRYKRINNPQGNSPDSNTDTESYSTSYKTTPDVEDINQDYTLNEYERYFQYHVSIRPEDMVVGHNFIVDERETDVTLRNGKSGHERWYQFRIPVDEFESRVGSINDFTSIRFMRMFLTNFQKPIVMRFGTLDLVRGEWRVYDQNLDATSGAGTMAMSAVNIEENNDKKPVNYVLPPGITREQDPTQPQLVESNEQALALTLTNLSSGESKCVYKNTTLDLRQYKRIQMFAHANALENDVTNLQNGELALFVRLGSDYKNNYYEYQIPLTLTPEGTYSNGSAMVWPEENMMNVPLSVFTAIKKARNSAKARGLASYTSVFSEYDESNPANKISILGNPTLGEVKVMIIGVRNLAATEKSGEVWVNELRMREYNNKGGWAAQGTLNMQLSDLGSVNVQGKYTSDGFGGLEQGVTQRAMEDYQSYTVTANMEMGKFFPDKAQVSIPVYYSVTKEKTTPRYNPLDSDMELDDALESSTKQERDSIESIAVTKVTNTNFSVSNARVNIKNKRHPTPVDPANFSFSYSHSHSKTTGETTVYEKEDNWKGMLDYSWSPIYKPFEPFKKIKSKSKWFDILKKFGLNYMPQNVAFNSDITRSYYELQERDLESTENSQLPLTFSSQFLWNREFSLRWDLTKNLHMNFHSATHAEIEEPYTPVNKDLYPERYQAWKDSVWNSIKRMGTPLDYNQSFTLSYQLPLNLLPIFSWINADANYTATYNWVRGTELDDGTSLGNTIANNRNLNVSSSFNFEKLYNMVPFLKKANERAEKADVSNRNRISQRNRNQRNGKSNKATDNKNKQLPKNAKAFEKEVKLMPDSAITIEHGKATKRITVSAKTADGKKFNLKWRKSGKNAIKLLGNVDTLTNIKVSVLAQKPTEEKGWYKTALSLTRVLMMVRSASVSYRNQYSMSLPGFMPNVGDAFGQKRDLSTFAPGLDFAFGLTGDSYINKAQERGWLMNNGSVATPATTNKTEDLQIKVTLEPVKNLKIDLNASRTMTTAKSMQYMYYGTPTTQSGTFTMTTISIGSAFEGMGNANDGYHSASFNKFCQSLDGFQKRVEAQYHGAKYPAASTLAGETFNTANGTVSRYSADVMIPAFLSTYTSMGGSSLNIFPTLARMLPNWSVRYSGLQRLPAFQSIFKSFNINHSYKSIYAVGSYSSYSTFMEYMNGLGFVNDATTGNPVPSSMYNVSTVSINEAFSPMLGVDMTFNNSLTAKLEYRTTRVLTLSMTSIQINEALSRDWVIGFGYKINDFHPFGFYMAHRKVKGSSKNSKNTTQNNPGNRSGINNALNMRLDLSLRNQAAISRDIATMTSSASSGNKALKLSFSADYTFSRLLTMSFYYDRQTNTPLLSSSSYPTTTRDFGLSIKFSLTR